MEINKIVTWILLGICCVYDLSYKKIPLLFLLCGAAFGTVLLWRGDVVWGEVMFSLVPGVILLLMGFFSGEKIGYGDGALVIVLGILEGGANCLWDVAIGLLVLMIVVTILLMLKKVGKETEMPFAPFLLVAHVIGCFFGV